MTFHIATRAAPLHARPLRATASLQVLPALLRTAARAMAVAALAVSVHNSALAHGDVTPQAVDTSTLPQLGEKWLPANPYSKGDAHKEALRIGSSAYNQNCARCHGLEAISGGIAPDLRKFDQDCAGMASASAKDACYAEMDDYYMSTVRKGRTRNGRVYMPPYEGILTQEAIWSIKTYLETRRTTD